MVIVKDYAYAYAYEYEYEYDSDQLSRRALDSISMALAGLHAGTRSASHAGHAAHRWSRCDVWRVT
jgi:hypothetical protein